MFLVLLKEGSKQDLEQKLWYTVFLRVFLFVGWLVGLFVFQEKFQQLNVPQADSF